MRLAWILCFLVIVCGGTVMFADPAWINAQTVADDPLVRMPGTQPNQGVNLQPAATCITCHGEQPTDLAGNTVVPGYFWQGSMMAQSARDPIFWACLTVALQDSMWALGGNPNAADICLRCHFPEGWLGGRSGHVNPDHINGSGFVGSDFDGVVR